MDVQQHREVLMGIGVSTYLKFNGAAEEALNLYREVLGADLLSIMRYGDLPPFPGAPELTESDAGKVLNACITLPGGYQINFSDALAAMGMHVDAGSNTFVCLNPENRAEADRIFAALAEGGRIDQPLAQQFWGDYFGQLVDRFGICWMINCTAN